MWDIEYQRVIEDLKVGPTTKPVQLNKKLTWARDILVEVDVDPEPEEPLTWEDTPMKDEEASKFRGIAARLNYLAVDRVDLLFVSKDCSRHMSKPRNKDWDKLKRIGRYLLHVPRLVHCYKWQQGPQYLSAYSDSDWAGCRDTRKSTSGGAMMHGRHLIRAYSKTQSNIALSSGEAEYYAMVKAASEGMGLKAMAEDFKQNIEPWLYVDATAAIGVAQRVGVEKIRHLETQSLWLQQAVRQKRVGLAKVLGTMNPADAMTKALDSGTMIRLIEIMGLEVRGGRPEAAPALEVAPESVEEVANIIVSEYDDQDLDELRDTESVEMMKSLAAHADGCSEPSASEYSTEPNDAQTINVRLPG